MEIGYIDADGRAQKDIIAFPDTVGDILHGIVDYFIFKSKPEIFRTAVIAPDIGIRMISSDRFGDGAADQSQTDDCTGKFFFCHELSPSGF